MWETLKLIILAQNLITEVNIFITFMAIAFFTQENIFFYILDFYCSSRAISNVVILICGSNCLNILRIHKKISRSKFKTILRNLLSSTKIQTVMFKKALDYDDIPNLSSYPSNNTLHYFYVENFQGTDQKREVIKENFLAIRQIQIT